MEVSEEEGMSNGKEQYFCCFCINFETKGKGKESYKQRDFETNCFGFFFIINSTNVNEVQAKLYIYRKSKNKK